MQDLFLLSKEEVKEIEDKLYNEYNITEEKTQELKILLDGYKNTLNKVLVKKKGLIKEKNKNIKFLILILFISIISLSINMVLSSPIINYILSILFLISTPSIYKLARLLLNNEINDLEQETISLKNKIFITEKEKDKLDKCLSCILYKLDNIKETREVLEDINLTFKGKDKPLTRTRKLK